MDQQNATPTPSVHAIQLTDQQINLLVAQLLPAISTVLEASMEQAVATFSAPTIDKKTFAKVNDISSSVLEKWISNGVVLLAPTPTTSVTQERNGKNITMTKHGNALINLEAWREKNRQQAIKCRYIKP